MKSFVVMCPSTYILFIYERNSVDLIYKYVHKNNGEVLAKSSEDAPKPYYILVSVPTGNLEDTWLIRMQTHAISIDFVDESKAGDAAKMIFDKN